MTATVYVHLSKEGFALKNFINVKYLLNFLYTIKFFFSLAGISEDSDYTSDVSYPIHQSHANSSIHQFNSHLSPYRHPRDEPEEPRPTPDVNYSLN